MVRIQTKDIRTMIISTMNHVIAMKRTKSYARIFTGCSSRIMSHIRQSNNQYPLKLNLVLNVVIIKCQLTSLFLNSESSFNFFSKFCNRSSVSAGNPNCLSSSKLTLLNLATCRVFDGVESK